MPVKNYELLEHTADIGIRIKGKDLKGLFENAASSMFDIIAQKEEKEICGKETINIKQSADNLDGLFINWLNELLSLSATKNLIFCDFEIEKLDKNNLKAVITGENIKNYELKTEIKAATYHELKLAKGKFGWQAEVIFDV